MHRSSISSTPPKGDGKRSRSSSPLQGGSRKAHTSLPKTASAAIQAFFGGKMEVLMLLQFLIGAETSFNWNAYQGSPMHLPEGQLTAEIVARWLLTFLFRKRVPDEPDVTDDVWHRVLVFLRENRECEQLKPLFEFLKKHQRHVVNIYDIPRWVLIVLCPICDLDAKKQSDLMRIGFSQPHSFWQNILQGLSLSLLPFWLNEQTDYIMHYLTFELLQKPLSLEFRDIIQTFLHEKPLEFFSHMPADLLILLSHYQLIEVTTVLRCLFDDNRRFVQLHLKTVVTSMS